ncbi:MAG: hypothetical protein JNM00_08940, partial [Flavobacteriales bacterium]|nr:hypothetical protein [Flavobacteriales bacterium]
FSAEDAGFAVAWALDNGDAIPTNTGISTGFGKKAPRIAFDDLNYRYVLSYSSYFSNSGADLIKFEPFSGLQSWSRNDVLQPSYYIENIFTLNVTDMHVDNDYNIYIAGTFGVAASYSMQVNTTPVTNLYTTAAYDTDLFVVKTDPIGYGIAAFSIPNGSAYDNCYAFALNKSTGDIFVGGSLYGTADFDPGAGVSNLSGDTNYNDTYVAKYTSDLGISFAGLYDAASGVFAMPNHLLINEFGELLVCGRIDNGPIDVDLTANTVNVITPSSNYGLLVSYASCGAAPAAPGSISGAAEVCAGNEYVYSIAAVAEATSYNWSLPAGWSGSSTGTSIVVNPGANSGTISVSAHNPCGTSSAQQIVVSTYSPPVVAQTSDNEVCVGQTVTLTGSGASSYAWNNGVTNGVAFAPSSTTTYTVTGTDANGCEGTADVTVTVNSLPNVSANANDASVCAGQSVTLYGSGAQSYTWNLGVSNNVAFVPVQTTTYTVTGTDGNGCTDTGQIEVTVNALPVVDANAVDDS